MKTFHAVIAVVFLVLLSANANAQTITGMEYFNGKWNVKVNDTPAGDINMVVSFEQIEGVVKASMSDSTGNELYKVVNTTIKGNQATVNFIGSQGEVSMTLDRQDEDHLTGDIYGMFFLDGVRVKQIK